MKRKKVVIILLVVLLIIIGISLSFLFVFKNKRSEDLTEEDRSKEKQITQEDCIFLVQNYLIGDWKDMGSDYPAYVTLTLGANGELLHHVKEVEGEREYEVKGTWEYLKEGNSLKLNFYELNDFWESVLSDEELRDYIPSVLDYSLDGKYIELPFHYYGREDFQGCEEDRYFIDFLNVYLYKVADK